MSQVISQTLMVLNIIYMLATPKFLPLSQIYLPGHLLDILSGCLLTLQTQHVCNPAPASPYSTLLIAQTKNIGIILDFILSHCTSNPSVNPFSKFLKTDPALTTSHQFTATMLVSSTICHLRTSLPIADLTPLQSILDPTSRVIF